MDDDAPGLELGARTLPELVVPERREEMRLVRQQRELDGRHAASTTGGLPVLEGVRDVPRGRDALDAREADPLDVPDHGDAHDGSLTPLHSAVSQASPLWRFQP